MGWASWWWWALMGCGAMGPTADLQVGEPAPGLVLQGIDGMTRDLSQVEGQVVVLEWLALDCPYVADVHAPGGALSGLPNAMGAREVRWWGVISGVPEERARKELASMELGFPVLIDEDGSVAAAWGAVSAPQVFVVDGAGVLRYRGAVDNQPLRQASGDRVPYAAQAIRAVQAGESVPVPRTRPYGCPVGG
jgi:peroxiredoxin